MSDFPAGVKSLCILALGKTVPSLSGLRLMSTCSQPCPQVSLKVSLGLPAPKLFPSLFYRMLTYSGCIGHLLVSPFHRSNYGCRFSPSQNFVFNHLTFFPSLVPSPSLCISSLPGFLTPVILNIVCTQEQPLMHEHRKINGQTNGIRILIGC